MVNEHAILDWRQRRWPTSGDDLRVMGAKLAEECGEVCGAAIKLAEGRRTEDDLLGEIGDVLIMLAAMAAALDPERTGRYSLSALQERRWAEVRER